MCKKKKNYYEINKQSKIMALVVGAKATVTGKPQLGIATVRFVGETQFAAGIWVGLELDNAGNLKRF